MQKIGSIQERQYRHLRYLSQKAGLQSIQSCGPAYALISVAECANRDSITLSKQTI